MSGLIWGHTVWHLVGTLKKVDIEKKSADDNKNHEKLISMQIVDIKRNKRDQKV